MTVTVVIPCYNHGEYIQDAIDSVLTYQDQPVEIIIVDDGSTDPDTISKIEDIKSLNYNVIQQNNFGLATARNVGIANANGKYILPLDADNKIKPDYIRKAIKLLDANVCDIVYAKPRFFGELNEDREFTIREFKGEDLIHSNYIDACAVYRKDVWIQNNGYDSLMPYQGLEDWDFWLNSYFNGFRFRFLDEELYEYRILKNSMIVNTFEGSRHDESHRYLIQKYSYYIYKAFTRANSINQIYDNDMTSPLRTSVKYLSYALKNLINTR